MTRTRRFSKTEPTFCRALLGGGGYDERGPQRDSRGGYDDERRPSGGRGGGGGRGRGEFGDRAEFNDRRRQAASRGEGGGEWTEVRTSDENETTRQHPTTNNLKPVHGGNLFATASTLGALGRRRGSA